MEKLFDEIDDLLFVFTEMLVGAVKCFIPIDVLDDEQVHKLDSIEPMVMDYDLLFPVKNGQQEPWARARAEWLNVFDWGVLETRAHKSRAPK